MEKELGRLFEAAKKAADMATSGEIRLNEPNVSRCMDALKQLESFPMTINLLGSSLVGKRILPLMKHPVEKIRSMAKKIRQKWKTLFLREWTEEEEKSSSTQNKKICPTTCKLEAKREGKCNNEGKKSSSTQNQKTSPSTCKQEDKHEAIKIKVIKIRLPGGKVLVRRY